MTPPETGEKDPSATLQGIIAEFGCTPGSGITEFTRLATAVQRHRRAIRVSDVDQITRSTALWTTMQLEGDIKAALQLAGVDQEALGGILSLSGVPTPIDVDTADLHEDFARAMRRYLAGLADRRPIELADLAAAILHAARDDSSGLLPNRMNELDVDPDVAIGEINRLLTRVSDQPPRIDLDNFSGSVRQIRGQFGDATTVTPSQIALSIQALHPDYGDNSFKDVRFRPSEGNTATTDEWLARVQSLYDMARVAQTRHKVIDGELTLLGLAELDDSLAEDLRADGFLDAVRRGVEAIPRQDVRDRTEWTPDAPAERDLLGRERLAEALSKRLERLAAPGSEAKRSFLVHIDGPWGAGKSTLFVFLKRQLEPRFLVVSVNAWREQRVGVQWWTLLSALRRAITRSKPWYAKPFTRLMGLVHRIRAGWVPFVVAMLVLGATLAAVVSVANFDLTASGKTADSILKIIALASAAFGGLVASVRFLLPGSRRSAQGFVERNDNPMQEVGRLFARTLRQTKRPVVFLIDDLDRCDESYVVEFLEVIQTLIRDAPLFLRESSGRPETRWWFRKRHQLVGPFAFIAADGRWIRSSYEKRYDTFTRTGAPGRPLGYLFLEKVFQLHVRLPSITDSAREAFLASLLVAGERKVPDATSQAQVIAEAKDAVQNATSEPEVLAAAHKASTTIVDPAARMDVLGDAAVKFSDRTIDEVAEHALARFSVFLEPNPRSMRLFVNTYGVLRSLRTLEEVFVPIGPLGLWTVIEIRWPYLADYLRVNPDILNDEVKPDDIPEDMNLLLRRKDVSDVLNDRHSGPLTPELIRQCSGS